MMQFLMTAMMIVFMSFLSCGSGVIGAIASAILPFAVVVGVGLMTLQFWAHLLMGAPPQALPGGAVPGIGLDPRTAFNGFMRGLLHYGGQFFYGLVAMTGRMVGWALPRARGMIDAPEEAEVNRPAPPAAPPFQPFRAPVGPQPPAAPPLVAAAPQVPAAPMMTVAGAPTVIHIHIHTEKSHDSHPRRVWQAGFS